ncbi:MAG: nicotinate-nucleotide pyrophosphorylase (carboxylating) [Candidatus Binatia bacterium]|jgi:nicotinate-nucleotide pyrophosphorylase (carboxylating)
MQPLSAEAVQTAVDRALQEDIGSGDATTLATVPSDSVSAASMVARQKMVVCGLPLAEAAFRSLAAELKITPGAADGDPIEAGRELLRIEGPTRAILTGERTALNFIQRLSGVATLTANYVDAIAGTTTQILDTRKTTPGWRLLEKYAVACGGGRNHRFGLHDLIMIKDNHLAALRDQPPSAIAAAVARARAAYPDLRIEVEADTLEQVAQAADSGADIILLDNMPPEILTEAVKIIAGRAETEASGGITLDTIRAVAETGVDFISVGALTHSAKAVDIGLDFLS